MSSDKPNQIRDALRTLAITTPKEARRQVQHLVEIDMSEAASLFDSISDPGQGRLRHLVAESMRDHVLLASVQPWLERWLVHEPDEFTRRAIEGTLATASGKKTKKVTLSREHEVFGYLASRMRHELRNGFTQPRTALSRLKRLASELENSQHRDTLLEEVASLESGFQKVGRLLEMQDGDEEHFMFRSVDLYDWLSQMHIDYLSVVGRVGLKIEGKAKVYGSDYLLRRVFWNLWQNAHRLLGSQCEMKISIRTAGAWAEVEVSDNGDGFSSDQADFMFRLNVSGSESRGQGLLEVSEALSRLGGDSRPMQDSNGRIRIMLRLKKVVK